MKTTTKGKKAVRNTLLIGGVLLGSLLCIDEAKANNEKGEVPTLPNSELVGEFVTPKLNLEQIEYIGKVQQEKTRQKVIKAREKAWENARLRQLELKRIEAERLAKIREEEAERKRKEELARQQELQRQQELERKKKEQQQKKQQESVKADSSKWQIYEITFYTNGYESTGKHPSHPAYGITASGKKSQVGRTIACPKHIPFGTKIHIEGFGDRICEDRGGAIRGNKIDVLVSTKNEAYRLGRKKVRVMIYG